MKHIQNRFSLLVISLYFCLLWFWSGVTTSPCRSATMEWRPIECDKKWRPTISPVPRGSHGSRWGRVGDWCVWNPGYLQNAKCRCWWFATFTAVLFLLSFDILCIVYNWYSSTIDENQCCWHVGSKGEMHQVHPRYESTFARQCNDAPGRFWASGGVKSLRFGFPQLRWQDAVGTHLGIQSIQSFFHSWDLWVFQWKAGLIGSNSKKCCR